MRCPCRKKSERQAYAECCEPYHSGAQIAPTAEALMRSRYAAFALRLPNYLRATWHASTRPETLNLSPDEEWLLLRVLETTVDGNRATVEFIARSRMDSRQQMLHEVSRFLREGGQWYYLDGAIQP